MSGAEESNLGGMLPRETAESAILFVINAHAATVNMRLYPPTSSMVTETLDKAMDALEGLFEREESLSVSVLEDNLVVNGCRLDEAEQKRPPVQAFLAWMSERGLSSMEFARGVTTDELRTLFEVLGEMFQNPELRERLNEELRERGADHITLNQRVYVALEPGAEPGAVGGRPATQLEALKDELLIRYLMGKIDVNDVEDQQVREILENPEKVGGLLSSFLSFEGNEGGILVKSEAAEDALKRVAEMVGEVEDESLRSMLQDQITRIVSAMSPREMTSVLTSPPPENLDIQHVRENVIAMLSDRNLLEIVDSIIEDYDEMKQEKVDLEEGWIRDRLVNLNELLSQVRSVEGAEELSADIDRKLEEAGIAEERDPSTGTRVLSVYQMLGRPLEEEDIDLGEGIDKTVSVQIQKLYSMQEKDLASGTLFKLVKNLNQESENVRRYAAELVKATLDELDLDQRVMAAEVVQPSLLECSGFERDYQTFVYEVDSLAALAEAMIAKGRTEDAKVIIEQMMAVTSADVEKGPELVSYARGVVDDFMGPQGAIHAEQILSDENASRREDTIKMLSEIGPDALSSIVDMVKDRGHIELRDRALESIKLSGDAGIQALLAELKRDNPWYIYRNILNVLAELRVTGATAEIEQMAVNPDERIRREAVRSLGRIGKRESMEVVLNSTNDASTAVRRTAVRVLGMFRDPGVGKYLVEIVEGEGPRGKEEDQGVMEAACLALGDIGDPSFVPQLADFVSKGGLFKKGKPDEIRAAACLALGNIGDEEAKSVLEKASRDSSMIVRGSAEKALRKLSGAPTSPEPMAERQPRPGQPPAPPAERAVQPQPQEPPGPRPENIPTRRERGDAPVPRESHRPETKAEEGLPKAPQREQAPGGQLTPPGQPPAPPAERAVQPQPQEPPGPRPENIPTRRERGDAPVPRESHRPETADRDPVEALNAPEEGEAAEDLEGLPPPPPGFDREEGPPDDLPPPPPTEWK